MAQTRDTSPPESPGGDIEGLLRDRQRIDEQLREQYAREVTVMFTDIKGSTSFFETYGDIEGRLMVQKHNEMLFPCVTQYNGRVIKTIGDAIMAAFDEPVEAVRAAIAMQETLRSYNGTRREERDRIHVRIGVNAGEGLVEHDDIFGDVVNVAARIESLTEPGQILVSSPVYDRARRTDDIICRYDRQTAVKGRQDPIDVYRVVWAEEDTLTGPLRGTPGTPTRARPRATGRRLEIDIAAEGETLRVSAAEKSDQGQSTLRPYDELRVSMPQVLQQCRQVGVLLSRVGRDAAVSKETLTKLRAAGGELFETLLPAQAREVLRRATVDELVVHIEDTLVQIPWELLYDGEQFLCLKFNMGRIVKTRRQIAPVRQRRLSRPLKMLVVADPRGDLKESFEEGESIRTLLDRDPTCISVNSRTGEVTSGFLREQIRNYDIVHYAGHAEYDADDPAGSAWLLEGGPLTAGEVLELPGSRPMPALVFCNACRSGQTGDWHLEEGYSRKVAGFATAFLLSGVQHYVGTFRDILDEPGKEFAGAFYRAVLEGATIGEAIREARVHLVRKYGEDTLVWAGYLLYGDPGVGYLTSSIGAEEAESTRELETPAAGEAAAAQPPARRGLRDRAAIAAGVAMLVLVATAVWLHRSGFFTGSATGPAEQAWTLLQAGKATEARSGFEALGEQDPRRFEGLAAVSLAGGDYEGAATLAGQALALNPDAVYARVINGNIALVRGELEPALQHYEEAAGLSGAPAWQQAEALNGIARIASARGDMTRASEYYSRAAALNPRSSVIATNRAWAMQQLGDGPGALEAFGAAAAADPGDAIATALMAQARKRLEASEDAARRERIDSLVSELAAAFSAGDVAAPAPAQWTSRPLTLSVPGVAVRGAPAGREGEDEFFLLQLSARLQESGRVRLVEREILDTLLEELRLSSTDLVDRSTALRLGRIMSARVIGNGAIMRYGGQVQVSLRLVDTETTAVAGAIAESGTDLAGLADQVAEKILATITRTYPLRATVRDVAADRVRIDIGSDIGVAPGMQFRMVQDGKAAAGRIVVAAVEPDSAEAQAQGCTPAAGARLEQVAP